MTALTKPVSNPGNTPHVAITSTAGRYSLDVSRDGDGVELVLIDVDTKDRVRVWVPDAELDLWRG